MFCCVAKLKIVREIRRWVKSPATRELDRKKDSPEGMFEIKRA